MPDPRSSVALSCRGDLCRAAPRRAAPRVSRAWCSLSGRYRWSEWLPDLEDQGSVMLRYEAFADCPEA